MSTTINKNIFDITTLHDGSSVDVVTMGVTSSGQPELDIGNAALVNDSSDNLKLNGEDILTRGQVDNAPTEDSTNLVTSGGVYTALQDTEDNAVQKIASTYDETVSYAINDLVSYEGKLYICIHQSTGNLPTNITYFKETTVGETLDDVYVKQKAYYSTLGAGYADQAKEIYSDRQIENPETACPPITFGVAGGESEIQSGLNKFETLYGNSKVWNQLVQNGNFANGTTNWEARHSSISVSNNIMHIDFTQSVSETGIRQYFLSNIPSGHKVAIRFEVKYNDNHSTGDASKSIELGFYRGTSTGSYGDISWRSVTVGAWSKVQNIFTISSYGASGIYIGGTDASTIIGDSIDVRNVNVVDLTVVYGAGKEPTTSAQFRADYPLDYYEYNAGAILSAKSASLISRMKNQCSGLNQFIRVLPNTEYEISGITAGGYIEEYDANKNLILTSSEITDTTDTTLTANTYYVKIQATTYSDIMFYNTFADNGPGSGVYGEPYVPYEEDIVTLPNIELRSVGSGSTEVRDEAYQTGGGIRRVQFIASPTWTYNSSGGYWATNNVVSYIKKAASDSDKIELTSLYTSVSSSTYANSSSKTNLIYVSTSGQVRCNTGSTTAAPVGGFIYPLATPTEISTTENPGWKEYEKVDNFGTLEFTTNPAQIPQVEQPYFIKYTINLVEFLDTAYVRTDGDANKIALSSDLDETNATIENIINGNTVVGKANLADNLESNNKNEDLLPYTMRQAPIGVGKSMLLDHLTGATVAWNQLVQNGNFANSNNWNVSSGSTLSTSGNIATFTASAKNGRLYQNTVGTTVGHKILICADVKLTTAGSYFTLIYNNGVIHTFGSSTSWQRAQLILSDSNAYHTLIFDDGRASNWDAVQIRNVQIFDLTQMFGSTIANYLYNQGSAGVNKFRNLFPKPYYPYNAGELVGVKTAGRKAIGVNIWNQQWELGGYDSSTGVPSSQTDRIRTKNPIRVLSNTTYYIKAPNDVKPFFYDANGAFISTVNSSHDFTITTPANCALLKFYVLPAYGTTYKNDICINISDASINGTFYPYEADEYPCDEVELNGLYTLDANNNIVAINGDTYGNGGTLGRKWKEYTFTGNETWDWVSAWGAFRCYAITDATHSSGDSFSPTAIMANYIQQGQYSTSANRTNMSFVLNSTYHTNNTFAIINTAYGENDLSAFKAYIAGKKIIYKLETPTEETASSFASTQKTGVTEQFMEPETPSAVFLPVGHDSFYLPDLKDKLEEAPDSPTADGIYLMSRSGGTNTYIPIANVTATQAEIDEILAILQ